MSESSFSVHPLGSLVGLLVLVQMLAFPTASSETGRVDVQGAANGTTAVDEGGSAPNATTMDKQATETGSDAVAHSVFVDLSACEAITGNVTLCQQAVQRIDARFDECCRILRRMHASNLCEWCLQRDNIAGSKGDHTKIAWGNLYCSHSPCPRKELRSIKA
ncbi:uncharacterized protein DMAD_01462 [Drosophila madeirensis]|uniref:Uncharacterized protein n=1 Tax=Drosophila madeirensis TaxID=30013 RepID=A0AAU9G1V4_DROMD